MQQRKNPLLIVLGVCGGCLLLVIIAVVVGLSLGGGKGVGNFLGGSMQMGMSMPKMMADLKTHNYASAASLMDPSVPNALTAEKLQKMEEALENKLGPMVSGVTQPTPAKQIPIVDPKTGQPTGLEFVYLGKVTYQRGTATASFDFKSADMYHPSGLITGFQLVQDRK